MTIVDMYRYTNIRTLIRTEYTRSGLSPLLFAIVMDEVTKDVREGVVKELLYADDLVLLEDNWKWNLDTLNGRKHCWTRA